MDTNILTKKEFAERQGCSPAYVSKLVKEGKIVLTEDGKKVIVDQSLVRMQQSRDPSKVRVAERHARERLERDVGQYTKPNAPDLPSFPLDTGTSFDDPKNIDFQKARAMREHYLAMQAKNEYLKSQRTLVERDRVERAAFALARLQRDSFMGLPTKIAPSLAAISDPWELEKKLQEAVRNLLADMASIAANDLRDILDPRTLQ